VHIARGLSQGKYETIVSRFQKLEFNDQDPLDEREGRTDLPSQQSKESDSSEAHWLQMAQTHRRNGNFENALRFYSRALEIDRHLISAWVGQVQMLILLGEYPQASTWAKKALEMFPHHGDLLAAQAQAECRRGDLKQSNALVDGAMKVRGETAYQWQVRGELMLALKQRTDRHCFDKAQVCASDALVPLETALIYTHYHDYAKAQQRLLNAIEKDPELYFAWYLLGTCQRSLGMDSAATRSFRQCIQLCPDHQQAKEALVQLESSGWSPWKFLNRLFRRG
jgi:tetratricopeptide (TPR) repeat protein